MATITEFEEAFEGTVGELVPTPSGGDENPGTGRTHPVYSSVALSQTGSTSADWNVTSAENTTITFASTPTTYGLVYLDFYLDVHTLPSASTAFLNWQISSDATAPVGAIRIIPGSGVFNLQLRRKFVGVWTSTWNLTTGVYRIQLQIRPEAVDGYRVKVFSGANLHTDTPTLDSGAVDSTGGGMGSVLDQIRIGTVSTVTAGFRVDDLRSDDTSPVLRAGVTNKSATDTTQLSSSDSSTAPVILTLKSATDTTQMSSSEASNKQEVVEGATGGHYVKVGGAWEAIVGQQIKSGGAWS
jgi:hypothetical protein